MTEKVTTSAWDMYLKNARALQRCYSPDIHTLPFRAMFFTMVLPSMVSLGTAMWLNSIQLFTETMMAFNKLQSSIQEEDERNQKDK